MEVGRESPNREIEAAASYGGGDTQLPHIHVMWEEQVQEEEERASKEAPQRKLPPPPERRRRSAITTSAMTPPMDDDGFTVVSGRKSHDKRPRDPCKDPTLRRRPSKASCSPLPFPLRSEAEKVFNMHTLFKSVANETQPTVPWIYDHLMEYYPQKTKEQMVFLSNMLCIVIAEFHLTCACNPMGICSPMLPQIVEVELPPLDAYIHEYQVGTQDTRVLSPAAVKHLGVWLHQIDMIVSKRHSKAKADSIHDKDNKLGYLLDYLLMPDTLGISIEDVFC